MPKLPKTCSNDSNMSILDEESYDSGTLLETIDRDVPKMNDEQKNIYDEIVSVVSEERGGMFFAYGFGGTGKTFIWRLLSASIRSQGKLFLILHQMRVLLCCYKAASMNSSFHWEHSKIDNMINDYILDKLDGNIYFSAYNIDSTDKKSVNDEALGPSFLNSIKVYGLPNHSLRLKISCHVQRRTHVRGWGTTVNTFKFVFHGLTQVKLSPGSAIGHVMYIPRLMITPPDTILHFEMLE
ncbi:unnamed protein product, partial [Brassica oleracea var. botrytis]